MRNFSSAFQTVLDSNDVSYFFLIKLELSQQYYFTSLAYDVEFDGQTYTGDGGLFQVQAPNFSTVVDREAYKVTIMDLNEELLSEFRANVIGKPIEVKLGLLDSNGNPMLNIADVVSVYKGNIDNPKINIDWDTKLAVIEGTSPMSNLDGLNVLYSSPDGMDQRSDNDTTFDGMYEGEEITIKWGRK